MQSDQVASSPRTKRSVSMDRSVFPAPFATHESAEALRSSSDRCTSPEWLERPYSWKISKMAAKMARQDAKVTQCQRSATEPISEKSDIPIDSKITTVAFDLPSGPHNLNVPRIVLTAADAKSEVGTTANQMSIAEQRLLLNIREQYYDMRYIPRRRRDSLDGLSYVTCPRTVKPKPTPLRQRLFMWIPEHCSLKKRDGSRGN
ncbi:hypothetical protein LTR17_004748 [Elasticomyces elasticus]|nr:hypothetical protein LTR17_004748 [Elasticomyces elasticus]